MRSVAISFGRRVGVSLGVLLCVLLLGGQGAHAAGTLDVYVVNVDHGDAVFVVTPRRTGACCSMRATPEECTSTGILAAIADAGVKQIDYSVVSHYDWDHFATLPDIVETVPIRNFVDHGPELHEGGRRRSRAEAAAIRCWPPTSRCAAAASTSCRRRATGCRWTDLTYTSSPAAAKCLPPR